VVDAKDLLFLSPPPPPNIKIFLKMTMSMTESKNFKVSAFSNAEGLLNGNGNVLGDSLQYSVIIWNAK